MINIFSKNLFIPILNLLANISIILPFAIYFEIYSQNGKGYYYLIPLLLIYCLRGSGVFLGPILKKTNQQLLILSIVFEILGYIISCFYITSPMFLVLGGIFLGIASSWGWPYFLSIRELPYFKIKKNDWIKSGLLLVIILLTFWISYNTKIYCFIFILLSFLYLSVLIPLSHTLNTNKNLISVTVSTSTKLFTQLFLFLLLLSLLFIERYARAIYIESSVIVALLLVSIIIFLVLKHLYKEKINTPYMIPASVRGFIMSFVLFYTPFYSLSYLGQKQIFLIYCLYLLGFEIGSIFFKIIGSYLYYICIFGLLLTLNSFSFLIGIFICSVFLGLQNNRINTIYGKIYMQDSNIFIKKYQFSSIGSFFFQFTYMLMIGFLSIYNNQEILNFFVPANGTKSLRTQENIVHFILIGISLICILKARKEDHKYD